uniref:Beta-galactosidase n=2 Tax=Schistocephalus solidus TaxID=70667 RepID=A0A0X3PRQ2_SCHSO
MKKGLLYPHDFSTKEELEFVRPTDPRLHIILNVRLLLLMGLILALLGLFNCPLLWFLTTRSFSIDTKNGTFLKDDAPFRYVSGSLHYFRIPQIYWMDRLIKAKAAGLNAIQIYIPWNFHEPFPGKYVFYGNHDVVKFISMAHDVGLLVLVRAGPYICAEWDFGGLPAWLLSINPNMKLRSSDPEFLGPVIRWFQQLFPRLHPYLYENGGPIIMIQLENEYGSYVTCDQDYLSTLYEFARYQLGPNVILYTTDGPSMNDLKCGSSDRRLFTTIDFNVSEALLPNETFSDLENFQPNHPLVNSEFYTGWFDTWGGGRHMTPAEQLVVASETIWNYSTRVSLNYYMFHGGSNFGFWSGGPSASNAAITTSYDYDAPISEAGDITTKYIMLRDLIFKLRKETPPPLPSNITKKAYGTFPVRPYSHILYKLTGGIEAFRPATMESCGQYQGFMAYTTSIESLLSGLLTTATLRLPFIKDVGHVFTTTLSGDDFLYHASVKKPSNVSLPLDANHSVLAILVENQGHINYGEAMVSDVKGILGSVYLGDQELLSWTMTAIDPRNAIPAPTGQKTSPTHPALPEVGKLFTGDLEVPVTDERPQDTFAVLNGFTRGILMINDVVIGRYAPDAGPQISLYIPANALFLGTNTVKLLELSGLQEKCHKNGTSCTVTFRDSMLWRN